MRYGERPRVSSVVSGWTKPPQPFGLNPPENIFGFTSVTATADTAAHTKGAWTQIVSSTTANLDVLAVSASAIATSGTDTSTLVDIGVGSAGNEVVIAENIAIGGASPAINFLLPVFIASGTRISCRIQSIVTGGKTASIGLIGMMFNQFTNTTVDVLNTSTATSKAGSINNTYTQLVASTSNSYRMLSFVPSQAAASLSNQSGVCEVGIGQSGSEIFACSFWVIARITESIEKTIGELNSLSGFLPAGNRIAAKWGVSGTNGQLGITVIGVPI